MSNQESKADKLKLSKKQDEDENSADVLFDIKELKRPLNSANKSKSQQEFKLQYFFGPENPFLCMKVNAYDDLAVRDTKVL